MVSAGANEEDLERFANARPVPWWNTVEVSLGKWLGNPLAFQGCAPQLCEGSRITIHGSEAEILQSWGFLKPGSGDPKVLVGLLLYLL